jgi:CDP-diacylglycerol---serine O-phosphatidyltransferase
METRSESPTHESDAIKILPWMNVRQLLDLANALTLIGLAAAVACAFLAIQRHLAFAVVALMVSGVCDLFDGVVARRLNRSPHQQNFGGRLDSIVDVCSFGFAPVVLMYSAGLNGIMEVLLLVFFILCVVWRLAFFDMVGLQGVGKQRNFIGLPVTYVAMILPIAFLAGFWGTLWLRGCVAVAAAGLAIAMVSTYRIRKPSGVFYLLFPASGLALAFVYILFAERLVPSVE